MVGVGVIGYGYWGPNLVRVFQECEGARVVAVCDKDAARLQGVPQRYPTVRCLTESRELIRHAEVDLVVVATPLDSHFELAKRAIQAGKHVLVEKPFTRTSKQAYELIDLADCQGVLLAVDHTFLFTPAVEKMKELIDGGHVGRINYVDSIRINLGVIREEIDVVWDLAPHDLSILDYLIGRKPERVLATGACHTGAGQVDVAYLNLDYGQGLMANIHVNWLSPVKVRRMIVGGDRQMVIFDDLSSNEKVRVYDSGATSVCVGENGNGRSASRVDYRVGDIWTPHLPPREALAVEAEHLIEAIEQGKPLRADGRTGLRVVEVLEACEKSLRDNSQRVLLSGNEAMMRAADFSPRGLSAPGISARTEVRGSQIPLSRPVLGDTECAAAADVLRSGWITQGPVTEQFEAAVAKYVGARHGVAVCNGTAALHLTLLALDVGPGDEVIVPSLTFIATANAVRYCGATPVFADVEPDSFNIDPDSVEQVATDRTKVILAVHQFGRPADVDRLHAVARRHRCVVVEDAACALGSVYKGRPIGTHSALVCFSFHPRKMITTGEGGMIVTDNERLAARMRRLRHHGMDQSDWQRHQQAFPRRESYVELGFNYRMSDLAAAVGLAQMSRLRELVDSRQRLAERYDRSLGRHPYLQPSSCSWDAQTNGQTYALVTRENSPVDRDSIVSGLRQRGLSAKVGLSCIHQEPCYAESNSITRLPQSESLAERMFLLPLFPGMTGDEQSRVIDALLEAFTGPVRSLALAHQSMDGWKGQTEFGQGLVGGEIPVHPGTLPRPMHASNFERAAAGSGLPT